MDCQAALRAYTMRSDECRKLADMLGVRPAGRKKIINMLWAAEAVIITTWLPESEINPRKEWQSLAPFTGNLRNTGMTPEIGAAQNMLLVQPQKILLLVVRWSTDTKWSEKSCPLLEEILLGVLLSLPKDSGRARREVSQKITLFGKIRRKLSKSVTF